MGGRFEHMLANRKCVLVAQSCPALCDPMDCSPPGFSVLEIFQARSWSGLPFPSAGDLLKPGIKPRSFVLQADFSLSEPPGKPRQLERPEFFLPVIK